MKKNYLIYFILSLIIIIISWLLINDIHKITYSFIGDEYAFFEKAKEISEKGLSNVSVLSQSGVYDYHPMLDSVYQGFIMKLFGNNLFGWKMSNIIVIDFSIILVFCIAKLIFKDDFIGLSAAVFFGFSHYLISFGHIGYNNLQSLPPFLLAVLFYYLYQEKKKLVYVFISGLFSGLCFYTFYSSRLIILIIIPFLIKNIKGFSYYLLGFFVLFLPFIFTNKDNVIMQMINQSIHHPEFLGFNITGLRSFFLSFYSEKYIKPSHFFISPIISFILATSFILGLIYMVIDCVKKKNIGLFLIIWFLLTTVFIVSTFYVQIVPITRLHIVLPSIALISSYGITRLIKNQYIIFLLLIIYIFTELSVFYVDTFKIHPLSENTLILTLAKQNKQKKICVYADYLFNSNTATADMINLYDASNIISLTPHNNIQNIKCNIIAFDMNTFNEKVLTEQQDYISLIINKKIRRLYDPAKINSIIYYQ